MGWFNNLNFRNKLLISTAIQVAILIIVVWLSLSTISSLKERVETLTQNTLPSVDTLLQADRDLYQAITAERSMLFVNVTSDDFPQLQKDHEDNINQASSRVDAVAKLTHDPQILSLLKKYQDQRSLWEPLTKQAVAARATNSRAGRSEAMGISFNSGAQAFNLMRDTIDKMGEIIGASAKQTGEDARIASSRALNTIIIVSLTGIVSGIFITLFMSKLICTPMNNINARMLDLAQGEGDLTARLEVLGTDELGVLAKTFNLFIENQAGLIREIAQGMEKFRAELNHVSNVVEQTREASDEQQAKNDQVATAITQMAASTLEVAGNCTRAANSTQEADIEAINGQKMMNETLTGINELVEVMQAASDVTQKVEEGTNNISTVMEVITGIASQTNLLALNAAIEAARAGEQGRGFAVVADEVRTLASRTTDATSEITETIEGLQEQSAKAVTAMNNSTEKAQLLVDSASKAGESLEGITEGVRVISEMNSSIAAAAEEQSCVADEITKNIVYIKELAIKTDEYAQQSAISTQSLVVISEGIEALVSRFKY